MLWRTPTVSISDFEWAAAGDVAVHELDLGAAALADVLRHRRPLDVGARVGVDVRARPQDRLDLVERGLVAFACLGQRLGLHLADLLDVIAQRLADAYSFAAQFDREAADRVVGVAIPAGEAGRGRDAVLHAVLAELGPTLAPQVGRGLGAVNAAHHLAQLLDALGDAAMHLADAEHRVLVAAFRHRAADAGGLEHVD